MTAFHEHLERFHEHLADAHEHLDLLGLGDAIEGLEEAAAQEEFRISVLGRFKHGKSTVVNALLGEDLSPVDILPCTSTVIEFRYGRNRRYYRLDGEHLEQFDKPAFQRNAGGAAEKGNGAPETWEVELPLQWLKPHIVLVDTPGSNEDVQRLEAANSELKRTDAALLILRADQLGSLDELEQAHELQARVGCLILVVNRIDRVNKSKRDEVLAHAQNLAAELEISPDRVLPLSATLALEGERAGNQMLERLRETISEVLLADVGGMRLIGLLKRTRQLLTDLRPKLDEIVDEARENLDESVDDKLDAKQALDDHRQILKATKQQLEAAGHETAKRASQEIRREWPLILERFKRRQDGWDSDRSPIFSPKAFATEVAEQAKADLERLSKEAIKNKVQPVISSGVADGQKMARETLKDLIRAISEAGLGSVEDVERQLANDVVKDAFGESIGEMAGGATATAVTAAVAAVVGYVIADVILYYVLGLIAGFLNPVLLVAAVVVGGVLLITGGSAFIKRRTRGKIADKVDAELSRASTLDRIATRTREATEEQFGKLAQGYVRQVEKLVDLAQKRYRSAASKTSRRRKKHEETVENMEGALEALKAMESTLEEEISALEQGRGV